MVQKRAVEDIELSYKDGDRPGVTDDVVDSKAKNMLLFFRHEQRYAEHGSLGQIKRLLNVQICQPAQVSLPELSRHVPQVNLFDGHMGRRRDLLIRMTVNRRKAGAENFMAPDDFIQSSGKGFNVQGAFQAQQRRNVVHAASRLNLIQEPEPLLRERKWKPVFTRAA